MEEYFGSALSSKFLLRTVVNSNGFTLYLSPHCLASVHTLNLEVQNKINCITALNNEVPSQSS